MTNENELTEEYIVSITCDPDSKKPLKEVWKDKKTGLIHRERQPAITHYDKVTGRAVRHEFYEFGTLHNRNGYAVIQYDPETGLPQDGKLYRHGNKYEKTFSDLFDFTPL